MPLRSICKAHAITVWALLFFSLSAKGQFSQARLQATGLTCALCSKAIHESLTRLPFVDSVRAELKTSSFLIWFKQGVPVQVGVVRTSVEDAGFFIGSLHLTVTHARSETERTTRRFESGGGVFQLLDDWKSGGLVQVIGKGFHSEKDWKRFASRYAEVMKDATGSVVFLLPSMK